MKYLKEKELAVSAVVDASEFCKEVQSSLISDETVEKKDRSPVTVADFGAQAIIIQRLKEAFPNDQIVAEEDASELLNSNNNSLTEKIMIHLNSFLPGITEEELINTINKGKFNGGDKGRFWTVDPVDGTKGFLRKEQYAVALALIDDGEVVVGVLGCPNLSISLGGNKYRIGTIVYAVKNNGAFARGFEQEDEFKTAVSSTDDIKEVKFCESVEPSHSSHDHTAQVAKLLNITKEPVRVDSQCKYILLSTGEVSIYLRLPAIEKYREKIWDHAAGYIIVKEAGGEVTDCFGNALDFSLGRTLSNNKGIVGTNGKIHKEVIRVVKTVIGY